MASEFESVLAMPLLFGTRFENFVFVGMGLIGSSGFKGEGEIDNLRRHTEEQLKKYIALVNQRGNCAEYRYALGTDPIDGLERLAHEVAERFPRAVFFAGKQIFQRERLWHKVLHRRPTPSSAACSSPVPGHGDVSAHAVTVRPKPG